MKPFLSIFGGGDSESPLGGLPVIFKDGVLSGSETRRIDASRAGSPATMSRDASAWDALNSIFATNARYGGSYGPKEAYALSPWMAPAIHAFASVVAARTFRVMNGK